MTSRHDGRVASEDQLSRQRRFGRRLRADRTAARLTQEALAEAIGERLQGQETVGQGMIARYEQGASVPSPAKLRAIAELVGVDVAEYQRILIPEMFQPAPLGDERLQRLERQMLGVLDRLDQMDNGQGDHRVAQ